MENKGEVSDGYHTFNELYEHRHMLFITLINAYGGFKTRLNSEGEELVGWFLAGFYISEGQISYHLPNRLWDLVNVTEIERNSGYDGHSSEDVLNRLTTVAKRKINR